MRVPAFPRRIEIELAATCNLRCTYCPRRWVDDLDGFIDPRRFDRLVEEASPYPDTILVLHRRGESLLHPEFTSMMERLRGRFRTVQLATNATVLDRRKAEAMMGVVTFLSFSIDTPERYARVRPPMRYERVAENIDTFLAVNAAHGSPVETQVSMVRTADATGADVARFTDLWQDRVDRVRVYAEHSADGRFGSLAEGRPVRRPCVMPFYETLVYCDGRVGRCNHDWDGPPVADLDGGRIADVWHGPFYRDLRRQHETLAITDPVCRDCDCWYPREGDQGTGQVVTR